MRTATILHRTSLWAVVAILTVSSLLAPAAQQAQKTLEVERIVLRDKAGLVRASIQLGERGAPELAMFDERGNPVVEIASNPAGIVLSDNHKNAHIGIRLLPDRSAQIEVVHADQRQGIILGMGPPGGPRLLFKDKNAVTRLAMGLSEETSLPLLAFSDPSAKRAIWLGTMKDGSNALGIADGKGTRRLELGTPVDGSSSLFLYDTSGHRSVDFAVGPAGKSGLRLFDMNEHCRIGMQLLRDGSAELGVLGSNGSLRVNLGVDINDAAELKILDPSERVRARLRVDKEGDSLFELHDKRGVTTLKPAEQVEPKAEKGQ